MIYLDTSVLVALFIPEEKSDAIQNIVQNAGRTAISSLSEVEFYSAVSRRVRMQELSRNDGHRVLLQFQLCIKENVFEVHAMMPKEYDIAREWIGSFDTPLRTLDALHLALAFTKNLQIFTADALLKRAAQQLGLKTIEV